MMLFNSRLVSTSAILCIAALAIAVMAGAQPAQPQEQPAQPQEQPPVAAAQVAAEPIADESAAAVADVSRETGIPVESLQAAPATPTDATALSPNGPADAAFQPICAPGYYVVRIATNVRRYFCQTRTPAQVQRICSPNFRVVVRSRLLYECRVVVRS